MGRKKESSDEYEPEVVDDDEVEENEASEEEEVPLPEMLTERRAKINRREIVESEDSDRDQRWDIFICDLFIWKLRLKTLLVNENFR